MIIGRDYVSERNAISVRPQGRDTLLRVSAGHNPAPIATAVSAGILAVGDVYRATLEFAAHDTPAGTHDGLRDGASSGIGWHWVYRMASE